MKESNPIPRWYQDFSIAQMQHLFSLGDIIRADYTERVTGRTQRALGDIGVTSTFVKITPEQIKKSRRLTDLDPVKFLCEMYHIVSGNYFTDEEYKKVYDCNERIILSAIAFLTLPETVVELHRRIPMGDAPNIPLKPTPQKIPPTTKEKSPYLEGLFIKPDWLTYKKQLYLWRKKCGRIPVPRLILPPSWQYPNINVGTDGIIASQKIDAHKTKSSETYQLEEPKPDTFTDETAVNWGEKIQPSPVHIGGSEKQLRKNVISPKTTDKNAEKLEKSGRKQKVKYISQPGESNFHNEHEKIPNIASTKTNLGSKEKTNVTAQQSKRPQKNISGKSPLLKGQAKPISRSTSKSASQSAQKIGQKIEVGSVITIKKHDYPEPPDVYKKSHLIDGKESLFVFTGIIENDDSPDYSICRETAGITYVSPRNSDEDFFAALNHRGVKKSYPRGRENLSRNWQEWFRDLDEDYRKYEKMSNEIRNSVQKTLKLMDPEISCDGCCSCRQTRKTNMIYHKTKTPQIVIDSIITNGMQHKYVMGSLAMNSPAPSPSESITNLPEIIDSYDQISKNKIISGVTNEKGETNYYVSGVSKNVEHIPREIIDKSTQPKIKKNVPPCNCAIKKFFNEGATEVVASDDNIPWTKQDQICVGKKYRPSEIGSSSCHDHPTDRGCRRNPFKHKIDELIKANIRKKENSQKDKYPEGEKKMYSLGAFQPCGDGDGMAVCGGPWGAVNVPDAEELARREAEAKLIRESPPCGDKPGRAICGAPFGSRHPVPKKPKRDEDEEDEEEQEDEDEEKMPKIREPRKKIVPVEMEKQRNRDERCYTVDGKNQSTGKSDETASRLVANQFNSRTGKFPRSVKGKKSSKAEKKQTDDHEFDNEFDDDFELTNERNSLRLSNKQFSRSMSSRNKSLDGRNDDEEKKRKNETKKLKQGWNRMKIMANKLITSPIEIPEDPPSICKREEIKMSCCAGSEMLAEDESFREGPFGWRTKSQQALPSEKTLMHLVEPTGSIEMIPVRPGGKPCHCRENRNAKKLLLYNVSSTVKDGKGKRDEKICPVIDGLLYITPPPSIRNSDEYVPEYELYESPYEKCAREQKNEDFKYIEKYLGPKSLMTKQRKNATACKCSETTENISAQSKPKEPQELDKKKWSSDDDGLIEFYSRCRDSVPCWLKCVEFSKDGCCTYPKRLQVKKPVCECKYERKILKREEEKEKWLTRQKRLKSHEKQLSSQVEGLSRPMRTDTQLIISDVKRVDGQDQSSVQDLQYCVSGIVEERIMSNGQCVLSGIRMHTPFDTPVQSGLKLPYLNEPHEQSQLNVCREPIASENVQSTKLYRQGSKLDSQGSNTGKMVDVIFQATTTARDKSRIKTIGQINGDKSLKKNMGTKTRKYKSQEEKPKSHQYRERVEKKHDHEKKGHSSSIGQQIREAETFESAPNKVQTKVLDEKHLNRMGPKSMAQKEIVKQRQVNKNADELGEKPIGISSQEKDDISHSKEIENFVKTDLNQLVQIELEKMASEGFLFAKLPNCYQMPQLQYWIMYRKGIALPHEEKLKLMERTQKIWKTMEKKKPQKFKAPTLDMPKAITKNMTWDQADEVKRRVELKRAQFYSNFRKSRILQARFMWGLMEFGKFPGVSFKRTFFTYQPTKESDGFVFKPWENS